MLLYPRHINEYASIYTAQVIYPTNLNLMLNDLIHTQACAFSKAAINLELLSGYCHCKVHRNVCKKRDHIKGDSSLCPRHFRGSEEDPETPRCEGHLQANHHPEAALSEAKGPSPR